MWQLPLITLNKDFSAPVKAAVNHLRNFSNITCGQTASVCLVLVRLSLHTFSDKPSQKSNKSQVYENSSSLNTPLYSPAHGTQYFLAINIKCTLSICIYKLYLHNHLFLWALRSRKNTPVKNSDNVAHRELLAIKLALKQGRHLPEGISHLFVTWTYHNNILFISRYWAYNKTPFWQRL